MSAPIEVPDSHLTDGNRLVSPLPAEEVQIKTALSSPLKTRVSVAGKIVQVRKRVVTEFLLYPPKQSYGGVYWNRVVRPSVRPSFFVRDSSLSLLNESFSNFQILMSMM